MFSSFGRVSKVGQDVMLIHAQAGGLITGSSFHRGMYKKIVPLGSPAMGGKGCSA